MALWPGPGRRQHDYPHGLGGEAGPHYQNRGRSWGEGILHLNRTGGNENARGAKGSGKGPPDAWDDVEARRRPGGILWASESASGNLS